MILVVGYLCDQGVGAGAVHGALQSLIRASADPVGGGAIQMIGGRHTCDAGYTVGLPGDLLTRVSASPRLHRATSWADEHVRNGFSLPRTVLR